MDTLYSRRNTNTIPTTAINNSAISFWSPPFPSTSTHHHRHGNVGAGGFALSGAHPPPPPYTSPHPAPTPTYSSLPSPQFMQHGMTNSSNPPLLPLPFSRSTSLPSPSPPARRASGRACRDQRRPKPRIKGSQQPDRVLTVKASLEDHRPVESPPPSSLPLPTFSLRPRAPPVAPPTCNMEAMDGDDVDHLLRLLRLE